MSGRILCIGGAAIDRKYRLAAPMVAGSSNPASLSLAHGGVARNVAETLARLGADVSLVTRIGMDAAGGPMIGALSALGIDCSGVQHDETLPTADYVAVLDTHGDLVHGLAAMQVLERIAVPDQAVVAQAHLVFADCNLSAAALEGLGRTCHAAGVRLAVDAVSTAKAKRLPHRLDFFDYLFLNRDEAAALAGLPVSSRDGAMAACAALAARGCRCTVISHGAEGLSLFDECREIRVDARPVEVVDVTGAGDALVAGTLFGLASGRGLATAARLGVELAARAIASLGSVAPSISPALGQALLQSVKEPA